jgi:hypothetical protein
MKKKSSKNPYNLPAAVLRKFPNVAKLLASLRPFSGRATGRLIKSDSDRSVSVLFGKHVHLLVNGNHDDVSGCIANLFNCYIDGLLACAAIQYPAHRNEYAEFLRWVYAENAKLQKIRALTTLENEAARYGLQLVPKE